MKAHHVVVLDNVSFHHQASVRKKIENTGAKVLYLPPYSPEYSPIENMWSKIKNRLRYFSARIDKTLHKAIRMSFQL